MNRRAVPKLLVSLALLTGVQWDLCAQEHVPPFVSRLKAIPPLPALVATANANRIPLEQMDPLVETNGISPGDSFTALVALFSNRPEMQWLLFLQAVQPPLKDQPENPRTMVIYNTLGHKMEFLSTPAFVQLRTIGPFVAGETGRKPRDKTTRFVLDQGFLGLELDQAAAALLRMRRSQVKGPFASGTDPFDEATIKRCRDANETWHVSADEERALAGSFPALLSYFKTVQQAPELVEILAKALDRPSVWSLLWHGGISSTEFRWETEHLAPANAGEWGVSGEPAAYYCPMRLWLNHHHSLDLTLVVTTPHSPLLSCAGVLGVLAEKPGDMKIYLSLRMLSARRATKS